MEILISQKFSVVYLKELAFFLINHSLSSIMFIEVLPETSSGVDNRNLISSNDDNQNLGKEEIHALRNDGLTGDVSIV